MRDGLEKWQKLSREERLLPKDAFVQAQADLAELDRASQYPRDGLVLSVVCRDLPRNARPTGDKNEKRFNQDYAWFRKAEARAFLPAEPIKGARQHVSRDLVERLARVHLIDVAWGHTAPFPQKAVERAELTAEVIDVNGDRVTLSYQGRTRASEEQERWTGKGLFGPDSPRAQETDAKLKALGIPEPQTRGIDARIEGHAIYDLKAEKFVTFELLVLAQRWGGGLGNGRFQTLDYGPAPLGFLLNRAGDSAADQVPPVFLRAYGWK
jgi:hypothetical protein